MAGKNKGIHHVFPFNLAFESDSHSLTPHAQRPQLRRQIHPPGQGDHS